MCWILSSNSLDNALDILKVYVSCSYLIMSSAFKMELLPCLTFCGISWEFHLSALFNIKDYRILNILLNRHYRLQPSLTYAFKVVAYPYYRPKSPRFMTGLPHSINGLFVIAKFNVDISIKHNLFPRLRISSSSAHFQSKEQSALIL